MEVSDTRAFRGRTWRAVPTRLTSRPVLLIPPASQSQRPPALCDQRRRELEGAALLVFEKFDRGQRSIVDFEEDSIEVLLFPRAILQNDANPSLNCLLSLVVSDMV